MARHADAQIRSGRSILLRVSRQSIWIAGQSSLKMKIESSKTATIPDEYEEVVNLHYQWNHDQWMVTSPTKLPRGPWALVQAPKASNDKQTNFHFAFVIADTDGVEVVDFLYAIADTSADTAYERRKLQILTHRCKEYQTGAHCSTVVPIFFLCYAGHVSAMLVLQLQYHHLKFL